MKTEDENAPTCTPYLPDDFVFDMGAEPCQAVGMKKKSVKRRHAQQKPCCFWAVMGAHQWRGVSFIGMPLVAPREGPQRFIPVFDTREQAVTWAGSDEHVVELYAT